MKILLASSEVHPYSKSGGLADMVGALGKWLGRAGHQVGVVTPLYQGVLKRFPAIKRLDWALDLPLGASRVKGEVWTLEPSDGLTIYFIDQPKFYDRAALYHENGVDYSDNAQRYIFLSKCVVHLARYLPWKPEVVHVHDWQTGLVPVLMRHQKKVDGWQNVPGTCLTVHNLAYQGRFSRADYGFTNLPPEYFSADGVEFYRQMNCLKAGIAYADTITAVSPRYAREITTTEFGCGLDGILRKRADSLTGILNGVDYDEWNTTQNPNLKHPYSVDDLKGKTANKLDLQSELGLPRAEEIPLFANITRLVDQKGVDIQLGALEEMLAADIQFVLLGSGNPQYEKAYHTLAQRFPTKIAVRIGFDQALSHRIEAGADFFLMPSRYEPCGLNQMYSLRYGTIPIVRITGGLDDTVIDITEDEATANGIKFGEYSVRALTKGMHKALALFQAPALIEHYRRNAMRANFSWELTAQNYLDIYRSVLVT